MGEAARSVGRSHSSEEVSRNGNGAKFNRHLILDVFYYLNELIRKWIKNTYKLRGKAWLYEKYQKIQSLNPALFYHGDWE